MSTQRFDIQHAPAPESFRLLYISKAGLAVTGTAPHTFLHGAVLLPQR